MHGLLPTTAHSGSLGLLKIFAHTADTQNFSFCGPSPGADCALNSYRRPAGGARAARGVLRSSRRIPCSKKAFPDTPGTEDPDEAAERKEAQSVKGGESEDVPERESEGGTT